MKILYIECNMGAAGDMLMAALLELHPQPKDFLERLNHIGIANVLVQSETAVKCGITGTHIKVQIDGEEEESIDVHAGHHHTDHHEPGKHAHSHEHGHSHHHHHHNGQHRHVGISEIQGLIHDLKISEKVKHDALAVYSLIADAESRAHGKPVEMVHFHEVGMMDAVADIVGVCMLIEELDPSRIVVSPIHVGSGQVKCAHGILPVPAPATAHILQGVPTYGGEIQGELCTPTGAALVKHFATAFSQRPLMIVEKIGYGMGKKEFPVANCVRTFMGESSEDGEEVVEISCNLDDMTGEELGFAAEQLLGAGALDVYITPIQMKKNRPGQKFSCLCKAEDEEKVAILMLRHTTSFGVRCNSYRRYILNRSTETIDTKYGSVQVKSGTGYGATKRKAEYGDLVRLASETGQGLLEIKGKLGKL